MTSLPPSFFKHYLSDPKLDVRTAAEVQLASLFIPDDAAAIDVGNHSFVCEGRSGYCQRTQEGVKLHYC